jgi:hypothetical protein
VRRGLVVLHRRLCFVELVIDSSVGVKSARGEEKLTGLIDEFTGLHDILVKSKTQCIRHLRL